MEEIRCPGCGNQWQADVVTRAREKRPVARNDSETISVRVICPECTTGVMVWIEKERLKKE